MDMRMISVIATKILDNIFLSMIVDRLSLLAIILRYVRCGCQVDVENKVFFSKISYQISVLA